MSSDILSYSPMTREDFALCRGHARLLFITGQQFDGKYGRLLMPGKTRNEKYFLSFVCVCVKHNKFTHGLDKTLLGNNRAL